MRVRTHPTLWAQRVAVVAVALAGADTVGSALSDRSRPVAFALTALAWMIWASAALATAVPHPLGLTTLRVMTPALAVGMGWSLVASSGARSVGAEVLGGLALVSAVVVAVLSVSSWVADAFLDGRSYGDERRFSLRIPATLLLGPVPLATVVPSTWMIATVGLLASRSFVAGIIVGLVGAIVSWRAVRSLHTLSSRFVVFVPAGLTIVDPLILADSVLFPRARVVAIGPAPADTAGTDLSQQAPGLALQLDLDTPTSMTVIEGRSSASEVTTRQVIFTPGRPAAVLDEAERRRFSRA